LHSSEFHAAAHDAGRPGGGHRGAPGARHEQSTGVQAIYEQYTELFGTNKPMTNSSSSMSQCGAG
jgi:hypothetical protein